MNAYENDPLENFKLDHLDISAKTAGTIADAQSWEFTNIDLKIADGSRVILKDSGGVTGLPR